MANATPAHQAYLARLYATAKQECARGIVAQTAKVRLRYWAHWQDFCDKANVDSFLEDVAEKDRTDFIRSFATHVRKGGAGRGHQVRHGSVAAALTAIGKTFMDRQLPNPVVNGHGSKAT